MGHSESIVCMRKIQTSIMTHFLLIIDCETMHRLTLKKSMSLYRPNTQSSPAQYYTILIPEP